MRALKPHDVRAKLVVAIDITLRKAPPLRKRIWSDVRLTSRKVLAEKTRARPASESLRVHRSSLEQMGRVVRR